MASCQVVQEQQARSQVVGIVFVTLKDLRISGRLCALNGGGSGAARS